MYTYTKTTDLLNRLGYALTVLLITTENNGDLQLIRLNEAVD